MGEGLCKKWVEEKNVFIHYCGKHKPWQEREKYKIHTERHESKGRGRARS